MASNDPGSRAARATVVFVRSGCRVFARHDEKRMDQLRECDVATLFRDNDLNPAVLCAAFWIVGAIGMGVGGLGL